MRESTRLKLDDAIESVLVAARQLSRHLLEPGAGEGVIVGLAWSITQGAATKLRELLERTEDGRAFLDQAQRTAAGRKPC